MTRDEAKKAVLDFVAQVDYDIYKDLEFPETEDMEDRLDQLVDYAAEYFKLEIE